MMGPDDATALVLASPLFDERWYADQVGRDLGSREEAVAHWVAHPGNDAPHPLFEPVWLYPNGWWRNFAPDPLSYYLSRERPKRTPHPRFPRAGLGLTLEDWLVDHEPAELLPPAAPRSEPADVVVELRHEHPDELLKWVRHLAELPAELPVTVDVSGLDPARRRLLAAVALDLPTVHTDPLPAAAGRTRITVDAGVQPPGWDWLDGLLDALDAACATGAAAVQPVLVGEDRTITAPARAGHPVSSLDLLDGAELATRFPGVEARREGAEGPSLLTTAMWLPGEPYKVSALDARVPASHDLTWAIDIAAGASPAGRRWGDWHFARSLADALGRLGQTVEIDHPETRGRATRRRTDVVLTLRGLERVAPHEGAVNVLWVISHPETVTPEELAEVDLAYAAGTAWAERHGVTPLLQCTDTTRFHPGVGEADPDGRALFVGNARGGPRPVVTAAVAAGLDPTVIGAAWADHGVAARAEAMDNRDLPGAYATAGIVLNDHHDDMRREGFVSNRVFDVLAVGGRLLTDDVAGLDEAVGAAVPTWADADDLARLARPPYDAWPGPEERRALAERVVAEHSFDARAATLLEAVRQLLDSRP